MAGRAAGASADDRAEPAISTAARWDRAYARAGGRARAAVRAAADRGALRRPRRASGTRILRDAEPELFGDRPPRRSATARCSIATTRYLDAEVGRAIARLGAGRSAARRVRLRHGADVARQARCSRALLGEPDRDGLARAGAGRVPARVRHATSRPASYRRGSIVDLAPTVLYYMGLPVGRDMDGFARTDLFRGSYTREHPVTYIATHER